MSIAVRYQCACFISEPARLYSCWILHAGQLKLQQHASGVSICLASLPSYQQSVLPPAQPTNVCMLTGLQQEESGLYPNDLSISTCWPQRAMRAKGTKQPSAITKQCTTHHGTATACPPAGASPPPGGDSSSSRDPSTLPLLAAHHGDDAGSAGSRDTSDDECMAAARRVAAAGRSGGRRRADGPRGSCRCACLIGTC